MIVPSIATTPNSLSSASANTTTTTTTTATLIPKDSNLITPQEEQLISQTAPNRWITAEEFCILVQALRSHHSKKDIKDATIANSEKQQETTNEKSQQQQHDGFDMAKIPIISECLVHPAPVPSILIYHSDVAYKSDCLHYPQKPHNRAIKESYRKVIVPDHGIVRCYYAKAEDGMVLRRIYRFVGYDRYALVQYRLTDPRKSIQHLKSSQKWIQLHHAAWSNDATKPLLEFLKVKSPPTASTAPSKRTKSSTKTSTTSKNTSAKDTPVGTKRSKNRKQKSTVETSQLTQDSANSTPCITLSCSDKFPLLQKPTKVLPMVLLPTQDGKLMFVTPNDSSNSPEETVSTLDPKSISNGESSQRNSHSTKRKRNPATSSKNGASRKRRRHHESNPSADQSSSPASPNFFAPEPLDLSSHVYSPVNSPRTSHHDSDETSAHKTNSASLPSQNDSSKNTHMVNTHIESMFDHSAADENHSTPASSNLRSSQTASLSFPDQSDTFNDLMEENSKNLLDVPDAPHSPLSGLSDGFSFLDSPPRENFFEAVEFEKVESFRIIDFTPSSVKLNSSSREKIIIVVENIKNFYFNSNLTYDFECVFGTHCVPAEALTSDCTAFRCYLSASDAPLSMGQVDMYLQLGSTRISNIVKFEFQQSAPVQGLDRQDRLVELTHKITLLMNQLASHLDVEPFNHTGNDATDSIALEKYVTSLIQKCYHSCSNTAYNTLFSTDEDGLNMIHYASGLGWIDLVPLLMNMRQRFEKYARAKHTRDKYQALLVIQKHVKGWIDRKRKHKDG